MEEPLEGWCQVPELVLADIVGRLPQEGTYLARLRLVCKGWCIALSSSTKALTVRLHACKGPPPQPLSKWMPGLQQLTLTMHDRPASVKGLAQTDPSLAAIAAAAASAVAALAGGGGGATAAADNSAGTSPCSSGSGMAAAARCGPSGGGSSSSPWPSWRSVMRPLLLDLAHLQQLTHLTLHEALLPKQMCQLTSERLWPRYIEASGPQLICRLPDDELACLPHLQQLTITSSPTVAASETGGGGVGASDLLGKWSSQPWHLEAVRNQLADLLRPPCFHGCLRMHGLVLPPRTLAALSSLTSLVILGTHAKFEGPLPAALPALQQLQLLGGVRTLSLVPVAPALRQLRELSLDISDLWYLDQLPCALGALTGLTTLHLQWLESNEQGLSKVRDLFTREGSIPFEEGMGLWSSAMCGAFAALARLQHFSFNLVWPKGGLNRLQPAGDLFWGELLRRLTAWLGAMDHSLSTVALEGQAALALTSPAWAVPHGQLKSLTLGDCHWQHLLQVASSCTQLTELVLLVEGEASGGTHISHQWTMPHLLRSGPSLFGLADLGGGGGAGAAQPQQHGGARRGGSGSPLPLLHQLHGSLKRLACVLDDKRVALKLSQVGLWGCQGLESLVLCLPDARLLPEELGNLSKLTELVVRLPDARQQQQRGLHLPRSLSQLVELQVLDLSWTGLERLGPELWHLTSLKALLLNSNQLSHLPPLPATAAAGAGGKGSSRHGQGSRAAEATGASSSSSSSGGADSSGWKGASWKGLPHLRTLSLANNKINLLPPSLFHHLPSLEHLNLACNSFKALPINLSRCQHLVTLLLAGNELQQLPPGLGGLQQLEVLDLTLNHFDGLPEELSQLTALTQLQLSWNHLLAVPAWLGSLSGLKVIELGYQHMVGTSGKHRLLLYSDFHDLPSGLTGLNDLAHLHLDLCEFMESPVLDTLQQMRGTGVVTGTHRLSSMASCCPYAKEDLRKAAKAYLLRWLIQTSGMWLAGPNLAGCSSEEGASGDPAGGCGCLGGAAAFSCGPVSSFPLSSSSSSSSSGSSSGSEGSGGARGSGSGGGSGASGQGLDRWLLRRWTDAHWLLAHRNNIGGFPGPGHEYFEGLVPMLYQGEAADSGGEEESEDEAEEWQLAMGMGNVMGW